MSETVRPIEIGTIVSTATADITANLGRYVGVALAMGLIGGLADTYASQGGSIAGNIALFFVAVLATHQTLQLKLGDNLIKPRFGAAFRFSLLSNLGIGLGLILLIVPGMILFARWSVGLPALLREELGVSQAMRRSSSLTDGNRWRVLGLGLLIWVPFLLVMLLVSGLSAAFAGEGSLDSLAFNIFVNLTAGCMSVLSAVCWTEVYLSLSGEGGHRELTEIFA